MTNSTRCALLAKQACTTLSHVVQKITPPSANNFLKLFFALFATLALGVGNAWAETITLTTNSTTVGKGTPVEGQFDYKLTFTSTTAAGNDYVQNAKSSSIFNTVAIPGTITSIKLTDCATTSTNTDGSFIVYGGTSSDDGCTNEMANITGLSSTKTNKTIDFSGNYAYFKIVVGSARVLKISSIVITYTPSGNETPDPTPDPEPGTDGETATATLTFDANKANRTSFSTTQQVWAQNGVTFTNNKASSTSNVADYSNPVRLYKSSEIVVECSKGNMTKIVFTASGTSYATDMSTSLGNSLGTVTTDGNDVILTLSTPATATSAISLSNQVRLNSVIVTYETSGSGSTEPALSVEPKEVDFGTVYQGATVEAKTVAVNFSNLTGAVTYNGLEATPFTATGSISATGDKITIAADASTIGEYSQTLTVASTEDSKTAEVTVKMNVVAAPAPTGTFTLHTGDLMEGDYVIVDGTNAMNNTETSNRLQYNSVTITNNEIVDPLATTIWHIAPNGEYWTVYSADADKYAASTNEKNQATLAASVSDNTKWTITKSDNTFDFENLARSNGSDSGNKYLRKNQSYGFACYASGTGAKLSLYRKAGTKYNVNISATTNGTVTADPTSAEAGTTITLTVTPAGGYVLDALTVTDASSNPITVTENKFTMPASDVTVTATFKENEKPAATLTLSKNGDTETFPGSWKQDDVVTLPSITSDCVKEFVGWSANPTCNVAPEYAPGAEYTLAAETQILYAVYADVTGGETVNIKHNLPTTSTNMTGDNDAETFFDLDATKWSLVSAKGGAQNHIGVNKDGTLRLYYHANGGSTLTITAPKTIATVVLTFSEGKNNAWVKVGGNTITPVDGVYTINATTFVIGNANTTNVQVYIAQIDVTLQGEYSNYSTTCVAALEKPNFSVVEGTYTEAKSIELNATKGDIYYTLDGTEPTKSSTPYTAAIDLDECGTTTIKAIAISTDSESPVASATYTINLPITNTAATAYTPAEAIAIIDGDCDKTEEVFVKGVVVSTSAFSAEYGNYDVIVKAVDDNSATPTTFTFYRMYKAAGKTKFTASDDVIGIGDIITAKGVLKKYNSTYELAEGCYMIERDAYTEPKTDISNTLETAYTVDKAFELISDVKSDLDKEVYVKGLVAVASTELYNDKYLTYSISDNGQTTGNVLKVYNGLDIGGVAFTSKDDVKAGDYVVVKGKLLNYNGTYEINKDNQLVEHISAATITIADITMEVGETKTIAATIVPAEAEVTYTIKENTANAISLNGNTITALAEGTATITATVAEGATYLSNSVDFTVTVTPQNIATLPFAFDGGVNDIKNTLGMSQKNLGADYGSSPKLKFDDKDDYVIIHFDERPGILTYDIKANTGSGAFSGEFAVQESADGVTYRDLVKYTTISGSKEAKTHNCFDKDTRYIKFILATKDNGNVALGNIKIETSVVTKVTPSVESGIFSVGDGKYVQFSTGNLQYEVGTNTWSFASEQYEVIGGAPYDPANPTNTNFGMNVPGYTGKLDLFAWSSDGKYGVNPSNTDADYGTEATDFVDWGTLAGEGWFTLTKEEMNYILNRTKNGKKLWALATIDNLPGLILLPDNWNTNITLTYGYIPTQFVYNENLFTADEWEILEVAGAVFLPAAGSRTGGYGNKDNAGFKESYDANGDYFHVDNVGIYGYYWLNTQDPRTNFKHCASYLILPGWDEGPTVDEEGIDDLSTHPQVWSREKRRGNSVRLVKTVEEEPTTTVSGRWELVTDASTLAVGDQVVIAAADYNYALSTTQKENNRGQASIKKEDNTISFSSDVQILTLEKGYVDNTFALYTGTGYLYAASNSDNVLKTTETIIPKSSWSIEIKNNITTITAQENSHNILQYNQSSKLFSCYENASLEAICLYRKTNVKVDNNQEATTNDIPNYSDVTVGSTGQLNVDKPLIVENLYIQTTMGAATSAQSAQISNATNTNLLINGDVFIDITLGKEGDPNQWHAFTVPFPVDAMNGVYDLNNNKLTNEVNYAIMDYHGDLRANGQYGWKKYRGILVPGTFYLMTVDGERTTYRFKKVKDAELIAPATKELNAYTGTGESTDFGWNGVGNPTLMHGKVAVDAQILDPETYTYKTITASTAHYTVGTPFFIQAGGDGTMTMTAETSASLAPARRAAAAVENIKVMLGNADYTDYLYVSASEDATNEYEIGKDLAKMTMTKTPSVPQIFAEAYNTSLCMIDAPMANNEAVVALNLYAPANGEYTLSVEAQDNEKVYLLHDGTFVWDLSMSEYPITLNKGDNAGYSILVHRADAPTSVETIDGTNNQTEKLIHNGNLYILHNGKVFDAVGTMLK